MMNYWILFPLLRTLYRQNNMDFDGEFPRYIPVSERKEKAQKLIGKLRRKKRTLSPVEIEGRQIACSFWGKAWCTHLETFSDYDNRIPRGRSYVRSGAVVDLQIQQGLITALVSGSLSKPYEVRIEIDCLKGKRKEAIEALFQEAETIELLDLLQGKIPPGIMEALIHPTHGIFPRVSEVRHQCSCPDYADFCKHQAAVLYGVGNRLDTQPELLFTLRGLDSAVLTNKADDILLQATHSELGEQDLSALFGVDLVDTFEKTPAPPKVKKKAATPKTRVKLLSVSSCLRYIMKYTRWDVAELATNLSATPLLVQKWLTEESKPSPRFCKRIYDLHTQVRKIVDDCRKA